MCVSLSLWLLYVALKCGQAFVIRVRRPQRLDEYVLRDESQFKKYLGIVRLSMSYFEAPHLT